MEKDIGYIRSDIEDLTFPIYQKKSKEAGKK